MDHFSGRVTTGSSEYLRLKKAEFTVEELKSASREDVAGVFFSRHGDEDESKWIPETGAGCSGPFNPNLECLNYEDSSHVVVVSAIGSHASYNNAGKWPRQKVLVAGTSIPPDDETDYGARWDCGTAYAPLGTVEQPFEWWLPFNGRWGNTREDYLLPFLPDTYSPHGPAGRPEYGHEWAGGPCEAGPC